MTLQICAKCSDMFAATLYDDNGSELKEYDGYVPDFMPGNHYGDYVMMTIDLNSGQILNWQKPTQEEIDEFIESK
jgi:hypothetical protein